MILFGQIISISSTDIDDPRWKVLNLPDQNPKHDPPKLQRADPVQRGEALDAEHVLRNVAEHLAAGLDDGLPPQTERAAPRGEHDAGDEDCPDEEVDDAVDGGGEGLGAAEDVDCVEDVVEEGEGELVFSLVN